VCKVWTSFSATRRPGGKGAEGDAAGKRRTKSKQKKSAAGDALPRVILSRFHPLLEKTTAKKNRGGGTFSERSFLCGLTKDQPSREGKDCKREKERRGERGGGEKAQIWWARNTKEHRKKSKSSKRRGGER